MPVGHVLLLLTYRCNLRCPFCLSFGGYWSQEGAPGLPSAVSPKACVHGPGDGEMTTSDIIGRVIPQCEAAGVEVIAVSGGEPLVRRDATEIFRALGASSLRWCLDTNLMSCTEAMAHTIVESGCDAVFVSLDGGSDSHNRLRGSPVAFDRTVDGIRTLLAARHKAGGKTSVTVNCVLQPGNETVPPHIVHLAQDLGADAVTFQLLSRTAYHEPFAAAAAAASLRVARHQAAVNGMPMSVYPVANVDEAVLVDWFSSPATGQFFRGCDYVHANLRIDPQGNVIPCLEQVMGNVLAEDLADIWTGPRYAAFRRRLAESGPFEPCLRCCNMIATVSSEEI